MPPPRVKLWSLPKAELPATLPVVWSVAWDSLDAYTSKPFPQTDSGLLGWFSVLDDDMACPIRGLQPRNPLQGMLGTRAHEKSLKSTDFYVLLIIDDIWVVACGYQSVLHWQTPSPPSFSKTGLVRESWNARNDSSYELLSSLVVGYNLPMTRVTLEHSKARNVDITSFQDFRAPCIFAVQEELGSVRSLNITSHYWSASKQAPLLLIASKASRVSSFLLCLPLEFKGRINLALPKHMYLAIQPHNLQSVDLTDTFLPTPLFPSNLVHLSLAHCDVRMDMDSLLNTLSSLPALETFQLRVGMISRTGLPIPLPSPAFSTTTMRTIILPRMRQLVLDCPMSCISGILTRIAIPVSCSVDLMDAYP